MLETADESHPKWTVDFEGMAKAFLSSEFLQRFDWTEEQVVINTTNILKNFYNYLLYHDVAPEFEQDILRAREICNVAAKELPVLAAASRGLPGQFSVACSTLFKGYYASIRISDPKADWVHPDDDIGMSDETAKAIFNVGIACHLTVEQIRVVGQLKSDDMVGVNAHDVGLEVVEVELPTEQVESVFQTLKLKDTAVQLPGKLHCKFWQAPNQPPRDLNAARKLEVEAAKFKK
jgi:hypothetical protein